MPGTEGQPLAAEVLEQIPIAYRDRQRVVRDSPAVGVQRLDISVVIDVSGGHRDVSASYHLLSHVIRIVPTGSRRRRRTTPISRDGK